MKKRMIVSLALLWHFIKWIWGIVIIGTIIGVLGNYTYTYLTTGTVTFPNPGTWPLVFFFRSYPYHFTFILTTTLVLTLCAFLADRSHRRTMGVANTSSETMPSSQYRQGLLRNVYSFVAQYLEESLRGTPLIPLGLQEQPDAVTHPLGLLFEQLDHPTRSLSPGTRLIQVFDDAGGKLLMLGEPGAGKTTLLIELARDLLERAYRNDSYPIPVVLNLSSWVLKQQPLVDWLVEELYVRYQVRRPLGQFLIKGDQLLLLLDGLDEVASTHRAACVQAINAYLQEHGLAPAVVCCRSADYQTQATHIQLYNAAILQPLTSQQIDAYLLHLGEQVAGLREALHTDQVLQELAASPLMLSVMTVAYQAMPAKDLVAATGSPASRRQEVLAAYIKRRLKHPRKRSPYPPEQIVNWLAWLASQMVRHSQIEFYLERLQPDWLPKDRATWLYFGRVPQFFRGLIEGLGTGTMLALVSLLSVNVLHWLSIKVSFGLEYALAVVFIFGFFVSFLTNLLRSRVLQVQIEPVETMHWSWARMQQMVLHQFEMVLHQLDGSPPGISVFIAILLALSFLLFFLSLGLVSGFLYGWSFGLRFGFTSGLVGMLVFILFRYLPLGLTVKTGVEHAHPRPNQGIWRSAWNSLRVGAVSSLAIGIVSILGTAIVSGFNGGFLFFGVLLACLGGLYFALSYGGNACLQHLALRWALWRSRVIPWKYVGFLNSAVELSLLRKLGSGYTFIHRLLLEHFALLALAPQQNIDQLGSLRRTLSTYQGHSGTVRALSWSPNGVLIASWGDDGTIQVWNAITAERTWSSDYAAGVIELNWSSDDRLIASRNAENVVQVWDLTPESSLTADSEEPLLAALSRDGRWTASWTRKTSSNSLSRQVQVWDSPTGASLLIYRGHSKEVNVVAWSPDGTRIASASMDQTVQVWDAATGSKLLTYRGHSKEVSVVAWSPDGIRIASASMDQTVQVWSATNGEKLLTYRGHSGKVNTLRWTPDGKHLTSVGEDENVMTIHLWDATTGESLAIENTSSIDLSGAYGAQRLINNLLDYLKNMVVDIVFANLNAIQIYGTNARNHRSVITELWNALRLLIPSVPGVQEMTEIKNEKTGQRLPIYQGLKLRLPTIAWSPNGTRLAAIGTFWGRMRTLPLGKWKIARGDSSPTQEENQSNSSSAVWSPDDMRFASLGSGHTVLVCDAETKTTLLTYRGHTSPVYALAWSPDGTRLASGGEDRKVQIWEAATGNHLLTYEDHADAIYALEWSPDGMLVASASADKSVHVWLSM